MERRGAAVTTGAVQLSTPVERERRPAIPGDDLALGLRVLADLFDAGLPMARALQTLGELAPASWREIVPHLAQSVREGKTLGAAFRDAPLEIPALVVGLTLAGERAGGLAAAVRRAAEITETAAETRAALRSALAYPALLAVAGAGTIALIVAFVIPRFATILANMGQSLPPATRLLLHTSATARSSWLPALVVVAVAILVAQSLVTTERGRLAWHAFRLQIPFGGQIQHAGATARVSVTLATLLETGVPLRQALSFAADANQVINAGRANVFASGSRGTRMPRRSTWACIAPLCIDG